jgi:hypothetical protein
MRLVIRHDRALHISQGVRRVLVETRESRAGEQLVASVGAVRDFVQQRRQNASDGRKVNAVGELALVLLFQLFLLCLPIPERMVADLAVLRDGDYADRAVAVYAVGCDGD